MSGRKLTHLLSCCKILPNYKSGLMYSRTLRVQDRMHVHLFELCALHIGNFSSTHRVPGQALIQNLSHL